LRIEIEAQVSRKKIGWVIREEEVRGMPRKCAICGDPSLVTRSNVSFCALHVAEFWEKFAEARMAGKPLDVKRILSTAANQEVKWVRLSSDAVYGADRLAHDRNMSRSELIEDLINNALA
jgi:hypothetical protein